MVYRRAPFFGKNTRKTEPFLIRKLYSLVIVRDACPRNDIFDFFDDQSIIHIVLIVSEDFYDLLIRKLYEILNCFVRSSRSFSSAVIIVFASPAAERFP